MRLTPSDKMSRVLGTVAEKFAWPLTKGPQLSGIMRHSMSSSASRAAREQPSECSILTTLDGRVLSGVGDLRTFFNYSSVFIVGRDVFTFIEKDRVQIRSAINAVAPNVTLERNVVLRPRERRPLVVRANFTRQPDDTTVRWHFSITQA
jgi:hypothetical protein